MANKAREYEWEIGNWNGKSSRKRPSMERVDNFLSEMSSDFSDYDVYLWGSWPNKETWDVDFLLHNDSKFPSTEKMSNIIEHGFDSSLVNNNFLADVGFTSKPVRPFKQDWESYQRTGKPVANEGYLYGGQWYADGTLFKDRSKFKSGTISELDNNMYKIIGQIPYPKMAHNPNDFNNVYSEKPMLIRNRRKIYGI
mgnify:CR=1 FL=1|tara:strand:- start:3579 stop:4166 length:588 start_codon:yes stop_codon:yes gene_type:complete